jgi:hypothetical protein
VLDPPIHSYSAAEEILAYWQRVSDDREHNGVFSAACVREGGKRLELVSGVFGMGPLYYRVMGTLVLFATNPRYLSLAGDEPDYMAWRCLIQTGFIAADRTLSAAVHRLPVGSTLIADENGVRVNRWFDFASLGDGAAMVDDQAITDVHQAFLAALDRVLQLQHANWFLPLSSGHDSRRILAGLMSRNVAFQSATVRLLQRGYRDLDARYASAMARDFGFRHEVIECPQAQAFAADDAARQVLMDSESTQHTWALPLFRSLPRTPAFLLDGIAGDILGHAINTSPRLYELSDTSSETLAHILVGDEYDKVLSSPLWPTAQEVRDEIVSCIELFPAGKNQNDLGYLLLHTRRDIAPWAQFALPAGHVTVCPYLEMGFVRQSLKYDPSEKYRVYLPAACLARFWPKYFAYPGNQDIPKDLPPGSPRPQRARDLAVFRRRLAEVEASGGYGILRSLLSSRAALHLRLAMMNGWAANRTFWKFSTLLALLARDGSRVPVWTFCEGDKAGSCATVSASPVPGSGTVE